ncbi:ribosome-binding factor A [Candidatus Photodesmus katoptron]|uniref:Ribosome-binding factor A n=1 Tax=Candidatus Photodesmus katoptron Akat1 TaxID=1236703 RepID=S3DL30_9GAMM|nr:30S ribosome-binding factor RbfA [Candidatus Photodesmus katoptron]EPE37834.1 ribosome-binding factor A [Candidatus Photodesmus katoptron Akat1]KEY90447.1 ribosome-binding factor A [Candidatus Photodesmus katoptron]
MPKDFSRTKRIAQQLRKELAYILQHKISEPSLGMITISDIQISRDLSYAKVFVTFFSNKKIETPENRLSLLKKYEVYIRMLLSKRIRLRLTPHIHFSYDYTLTKGRHISNLINKDSYRIRSNKAKYQKKDELL